MSKSDHSSQRTDEDERDAASLIHQPGARIGKYIVIEPIGAGAMGVVVRAYDPDLERSVAVKVVQPGLARSPRSETSRARLLVEARAMARISHPNVVAIYEVGEHEGLVYVAMELVDGVDLQRWLKEQPRSWRSIVDAFVAAGRGLHQVHVAGLVHRDVKPANILVGSDGRVRIGDFGIARATFELPSPVADVEELDAGIDADTTAFTAEGHVVGTLAYMAPEQHMAIGVGPAADQYAFCVALYESLWRVRPFAVELRRLVAAKLAGPVEPPRTRDVPHRLFSVLARGLDPDPTRRFASMEDLCDALARDPGARTRRLAVASVGALAVGAVTVAFATRTGPCDSADDPLEVAWDPSTRVLVEESFVTSTRPWAPEAWAYAGERLDDYAAQWSAMRRDACEATHVRGEQTAEMLDRRVVCLEERRRVLAATTRVLAEGGDEAVDHAFDLVGRLRPLAPCSDPVALASAIEPPDRPGLRDGVDAARGELARARALVQAGRHREAAELAEATTATARELDYGPLVAEALAFEGETRLRVGRAAEARALLEESLWIAIAAGHDEAAAEAASSLVWLAGQHERAIDEAMRWGELASASLHRHHSDDPDAWVQLENAIAASQINAARYDEGLQTFERALARIADDPRAVARAGMLRHNIAKQWLDRGELERARAVLEPTIAELEPVLGRDHPRLVGMRGTLAQILGSAGDHGRAAELFRQEVDGLALAYGDDAIQVAYARSNLGLELGAIGDTEAAIAEMERSIATFERLEDGSGGATALITLASMLLEAGAHDAAEQRFERALAILETLYPDENHPDLAHPLVGLGGVHMAKGRYAQAIASFERAERILQGLPGAPTDIRDRAREGLDRARAAASEDDSTAR